MTGFRHRRRGPVPAGTPTHHERLSQLIADANTNDCIIFTTPAPNRGGYGTFKLNGRRWRAHNYVCHVTHGPPPTGMVAAHWCGVAQCVNPRHIRWATVLENNRDTYAHGTRVAREQHPNTHLTEFDIAEIRRLYGTGLWLQKELGVRYGVTFQCISKIVRNQRWVDAA